MQIGDKVRATLKVSKKSGNGTGKELKKGKIYSLTDRLIVIEYINRYGEPTYRESFKLSDIIEKKAIIEVKEDGTLVQVTPMNLKL